MSPAPLGGGLGPGWAGWRRLRVLSNSSDSVTGPVALAVAACIEAESKAAFSCVVLSFVIAPKGLEHLSNEERLKELGLFI